MVEASLRKWTPSKREDDANGQFELQRIPK